MKTLIDDFLSQDSFAVIGSYRNETAYAYQIFRKLKSMGRNVYPVSPNAKTVDGDPCYARVSDIPHKIDVANLITPPPVSLKIAEECKRIGITKIWMQPGAESSDVIQFCVENGVDALYGICVLLQDPPNKPAV
jgi:uncharacterized protein